MNRKYKEIFVGVFGFISLYSLTFFLGYQVYSFTKKNILPYGKFPWTWQLELTTFTIYLSVFVSLLILVFVLRSQLKKSRMLSLFFLYILWLSFPTATYWSIDSTDSFQNEASEPILLIVPHVLTPESGLYFVPVCEKECKRISSLLFIHTFTVANAKFYDFVLSNVIFSYCLKIVRQLEDYFMPENYCLSGYGLVV